MTIQTERVGIGPIFTAAATQLLGVSPVNYASEQPGINRDRLLLLVLIVVTTAGIIGCILIAAPFLPAVTWAVSLAVVAHPVHDWMLRHVKRPSLAAALAVAVITFGLVAPAVFVGREVGQQATQGFQRLQGEFESEDLLSKLEQNPKAAPLARWIRNNVDVSRELKEFGEALRARLAGFLRGVAWTATQFLITLFLLFYLFRDRQLAIRAAVSFFPLSNKEAGEVVGRVKAMIHATIYGTVVVATIQGALGGLMFWILGVPGPLLWGVAMGLLSIIPMLGAFVIWLPVAASMAAQGEWVQAMILTAWGTVVVGFIDNLLYPVLVGKETRLHTVPVFIAIIGGLLIFGASGLVIGPVIFAMTLACLDVLRQRTIGNRSAEASIEQERRAS